MNKTLMPALLVATIMVAGAFAFMPVEQASTVHTTILDQTGLRSITSLNELDGADNLLNGVTTIDVDDDAQILAIYFCDIEYPDADDDVGISQFTIDGGLLSTSAGAAYGLDTDIIINDGSTFATDDCVEILSEVSQAFADYHNGMLVTDALTFTVTTAGADADDDADGFDITVLLIGGGATPTVDHTGEAN